MREDEMMKRKNKRQLTWMVGGAVLLLILAWAFWPRPEPADIALVGPRTADTGRPPVELHASLC